MTAAAATLAGLLGQAETETEHHINPVLAGGGTFVLFLVLLLITLQFDKER